MGLAFACEVDMLSHLLGALLVWWRCTHLCSIAGLQISGERGLLASEAAFLSAYALGGPCSWGFFIHPLESQRHRPCWQGGSQRCSPEVCSIWDSLQVTRLFCPRGYLNTAFPFPSFQDDDHFSPEADAAMSEMTGNTALLAQVCGWGRRLAGQPGTVRRGSYLVQLSVQAS